jgi:hypothetical protein
MPRRPRSPANANNSNEPRAQRRRVNVNNRIVAARAAANAFLASGSTNRAQAERLHTALLTHSNNIGNIRLGRLENIFAPTVNNMLVPPSPRRNISVVNWGATPTMMNMPARLIGNIDPITHARYRHGGTYAKVTNTNRNYYFNITPFKTWYNRHGKNPMTRRNILPGAVSIVRFKPIAVVKNPIRTKYPRPPRNGGTRPNPKPAAHRRTLGGRRK